MAAYSSRQAGCILCRAAEVIVALRGGFTSDFAHALHDAYASQSLPLGGICKPADVFALPAAADFQAAMPLGDLSVKVQSRVFDFFQ